MKSRMRLSFFLGLIISLFCMVLLSSHQRDENIEDISAFNQVLNRYKKNLNSLIEEVEEMRVLLPKVDASSLQNRFQSARSTYKKIEWLVEFRFRESSLKINGPNLLEAEASQPNIPLYPCGFQVVEEVIYAQPYKRNKVQFQLDGLLAALKNIQKQPVEYLSQSTLIYAHKLNLYRLISKGIVHFDCPIALSGLTEAKTTLRQLDTDLQTIQLNETLSQKIKEALAFLEEKENEPVFPYFDFLQTHLNPLCDQVAEIQQSFQEKNQTASFTLSALRSEAGSMFARGAFDPLFFAPSDALPLDSLVIRLGEKLYHDKRLSADGSRSCASCHMPDKAFADGLKVNQSLSSTLLMRNTPTLWNVAFQNTQFADSRVVFIEDQIHAVVTNKNEMHGTFKQIVSSLNNSRDLRKSFQKLVGSEGITDRNIKRVLAAYLRSLQSFDSKFDQAMRSESSVDDAMKKGFDLFMGKGKCGTCHFVPLFNGSATPYFDKMESEVLGVPMTNTHPSLVDPDVGKFSLHQIPHQKYAFKTVSLRKVGATGPFMHNGVFTTLKEVLDFYNNGGGIGYGIELDNQTLSTDPLGLNDQEIQAIIYFLESL